MNKAVVIKYMHRADLNRECRLLLKSALDTIECMIYTVKIEDEHIDECWTGLVTSVKKFIKEQNVIMKQKIQAMTDKSTD